MAKTLKDIMTALPVTIEEGTTLQNTLKLMRKEGVSHLLVRDHANKLTGVISKQDVLDKLFKLLSRTTGKTYTSLELNGISVTDIMTAQPYRLGIEAGLDEAARLLLKNHINCIPVTDSTNTIVGVVTSYDIMKHTFS